MRLPLLLLAGLSAVCAQGATADTAAAADSAKAPEFTIKPAWDLRTLSMSGTMQLNADHRRVTRVNSQGDETISGNCVVGEGEWSVKLGFPGAHRYTYVGVQSETTQVCRWLGCTPTSWALRADGYKAHAGASDMPGGFKMADGDIITLKLNNGVLKYYQNGIDKGVEFTGLPTDASVCVAVSLWSPYSWAEIQWLESSNPVQPPTPSPMTHTQAVWDPTTKSGSPDVISVSADGLVAERAASAPGMNQAVYGTCRLGLGSWKVKLTFPNEKRFTYIGLATFKTRNCNWVGCDDQSWAVRADGYLSHAGDSGIAGGFHIASGDVVEMRLAENGDLEYLLNGVSKGALFSGLPTSSPLCLATSMEETHSTVEIQRRDGAAAQGGGQATHTAMPTIRGWDDRSVTHENAISVGPLHKLARREHVEAGSTESVRAGCVVGSGEWEVEVGFPRGEGTRETYIGVQELGTVACRWVGCSTYSWGAIGTGKLAHNNLGNLDGGFVFDDRDKITVRLKDGTLQYEKNGIDMGALFQNLPRNRPLCLTATMSAPGTTVTILSQPATVNQQVHVAAADWSTGSPTVWDEGSIYPREGGLFSLDAKRKVVSRTNSFKLATVEGHCYVGHGSWKVELQAQQHNQRGDIAVDYIGVQVAGTQCAWVGCDTNSWGVRSDGRKSHGGSNELLGGFEIRNHDIVEVVVEKGGLYFKLNGVPQGKLFDGLPEDQALCFAVTMYSPLSSATFLRPPPACALPPQPTAGTSKLQGQWVGALAEFTCNEGYIRSGSAQRRCQQNGKWTGLTTFCNKDACGATGGAAANEVVHKEMVKGVVSATYECDDGTFELVGVAKRSCDEAAGEWSAPEPVCKKKCLALPPTPEHATIAFNHTYAGSQATYTCDAGYFTTAQETASTITCMADGQWNTAPASCSPLRCQVPRPVKHAVKSVSCHEFGCITAYECEAPYQMVGSAETQCGADGFWSQPPECVLMKECKELYCELHWRAMNPKHWEAHNSTAYQAWLNNNPKHWRTIVRHMPNNVPEPNGRRHRCQFERLEKFDPSKHATPNDAGRCVCECWNPEGDETAASEVLL
eukprot:g3897.t1